MKKMFSQTNRVKAADILLSIGTVIYTALFTIMPVMADEEITAQVTNGLAEVYKTLTAIVVPIAAILLLICGIKYMRDEREAQSAKTWAIRIVIGLAVCYLAPFLAVTVAGWFNKGGTTINGVTFGG